MTLSEAAATRARLGPEGPDLVAAARWCVETRGGDGARIDRLATTALDLDASACRAIADGFAAAPRLGYGASLAARYDRMKVENLTQFTAIEAAGIEVRPWLRPGQPYRDSAHLVRRVRATGVLFVFLTRDGHGPPGSTGFHPLREPSGLWVAGVELTHNDVFRAVHDAFGHVMFGHSFGPAGELLAAYCHMALYSDVARPVLFTEQVAQICWFFYGPHLRRADGQLRRPGEPGYVPPADRPYPEQKVYDPAASHVAAFRRMFREEAP